MFRLNFSRQNQKEVENLGPSGTRDEMFANISDQKSNMRQRELLTCRVEWLSGVKRRKQRDFYTARNTDRSQGNHYLHFEFQHNLLSQANEGRRNHKCHQKAQEEFVFYDMPWSTLVLHPVVRRTKYEKNFLSSYLC